jgi:tetratricopeptide (TPR) repeat protein
MRQRKKIPGSERRHSAIRSSTNRDIYKTHTTGVFATVLALAGQVPELPSSRAKKKLRAEGPDLKSVDFFLHSIQQTPVEQRPRRPDALIDACCRLAGWADYCDQPGTALGYVQAAIEFYQDSPHYRAGKHAAQLGRREAVDLFRLAIHYARTAGDWEQVARSWTQIGRLHLMAKEFREAEDAHASALRVARTYGLRRQEAQALHNLATSALDQHDGDRAFIYARLALQAYGLDFASLSLLANDVAYHWMVDEGAYALALDLFEACLPYTIKPIHRLDILGNIARAAAGSGMVAKYDRVARELRVFAVGIPFQERVAGALLEVAEGAHMLRRYGEAEAIALEAREIALSRREKKYVAHADKLLEKVERQEHSSPRTPSGIGQLKNRDLAERLTALLKRGQAEKR